MRKRFEMADTQVLFGMKQRFSARGLPPAEQKQPDVTVKTRIRRLWRQF